MAKQKTGLVFFDTSSVIHIMKKVEPGLSNVFSGMIGATCVPALSSITMAELLVKDLDGRKRNDHALYLNSIFAVFDFEQTAAVKAAGIYAENMELKNKWSEIGGRQVFRCDTMILATALVNNAMLIVTDDDKLLKLASHYVKTETLANIMSQPELSFMDG